MPKIAIPIFFLVLVSFVLAFSFYQAPCLPDKLASHWSLSGEVNGYMDKFWGLFLMPIISLVLAVMFLLLPKIDPLKENMAKFRKYYHLFILLVLLFLFYLYLLTLAWNTGFRFNMPQFLSPAFGVLFYAAGVLTSKAKRNWFVGIRTPWTMSSDFVWDKTHELGGKLFKTTGLLSLLGIFFPQHAIFLVLTPSLFSALGTIVYSYLLHRKETNARTS